MQTLTLTFTLEETNLILEALGQLPFNQVYQLIGKIQNEASEQLQTASPKPRAIDRTTVPKSTEVSDRDQ